MKAILICNGKAPPRKFLRGLLKNYDIIACADGGANIAFKFKILPNFIIGDLDSIKPNVKKTFEKNNVAIIHDPSQDSTDIEKSVKFLISKGIKHIDIVSAIGGDRVDHNLGNLSILINYHNKAKLRIIDEFTEIFFVKNKTSFDVNPGDTISIFPFCKAEGVKTKGLKYALKDEVLTFSGRGVSNIAIGKKVFIEVKKGGIIVYRKMIS